MPCRTQDLHIYLRDGLCRVCQGGDRLEHLARPDVRWGGQSATTVALPPRCLSAPYITEVYTYIFAFAHAHLTACVLLHARSRARSSTRGNRTVENQISAVLFLCVAIRRQYSWHKLPITHVIHANYVQLRGVGSLWPESFS